MSEHEAGHAMNARIAEEVMGWKPWRSPLVPRGTTKPDCWKTGSRKRPTVRMSGWRPSTDFADAMAVVLAVQAKHPGWRFMLLGGDVEMGYKVDRGGGWLRDADGGLIVDEDSRFAFGWRAEFMGDMDPRKNTGRRHGEAHAATPALAICRAALLAAKAPHA